MIDFAPGWDRRDRVTLRFKQVALEAAYQVETAPAAVRQVRSACVIASAAWLVNALLAPPVLGVDAHPAWAVAVALVGVLGGAYLLTPLARARLQLEAIGIAIQAIAALAVLVLATVTHQFVGYAAVGVILTMVIGFGVQRHPFALSVPLGIFQAGLFVAFGIALGVGPQLVFQTF